MSKGKRLVLALVLLVTFCTAAHAFHHHAAGRRRNMVNQPEERRRMGGRDRFVGSVHTAAGRNRRGRRSAAHLVEFQELRRQHRT